MVVLTQAKTEFADLDIDVQEAIEQILHEPWRATQDARYCKYCGLRDFVAHEYNCPVAVLERHFPEAKEVS